MTHSTKPILTYFKGAGLADPTRLLFAIGGVDFVDRRLTADEWRSRFKSYSPTGEAPFIEVDGNVIVNSSAVVQYAAKRAGLDLGNDPIREAQAMAIADFLAATRNSIYGKYKGEEMSVLRTKLTEEYATQGEIMLKTVNALVETIDKVQEGDFLFGKLTYADVVLASFIYAMESFLQTPVLSSLLPKYPKLQAAVNAVNALPAVKKVHSSYGEAEYTLHGFYYRDRGEPIRWAFALGGVPLNDKMHTFDEWKEMKASTLTGKMPYMEVTKGDSTSTIVESRAILLLAARVANLVPPCNVDAAFAHGVMVTANELREICYSLYHTPEDKREEAKPATVTALQQGLLRLERVLQSRKEPLGYVVGGRPSYADLEVASVFRLVAAQPFGMVVPDLYTEYPRFLQVHDLVMALPAVQRSMINSTKTKPVLVYFDVIGRGEAIRRVFKHGNIDFEDRRITGDQWPALKPETQTGRLPYLEVDGNVICETRACLQYAAERADLVPYTWEGRVHAETLTGLLNDAAVVSLEHRRAEMSGETDLKQYHDRFAQCAALLEKFVATKQSAEGYCVENRLTWIDFHIGCELQHYVQRGFFASETGVPQDKYPALHKLNALIYSLPN